MLLAVEADVQAPHLNGATNAGAVAYPGTRAGSFTVTSHANADWLFAARPVSALGTLAGRVGYAWDRALVYAKGGGAWTDTTFHLLGDTSALMLGAGDTTQTTWGWMAGGGIEYALTNHWTTLVEYDHIGIPGTTVPFPTVAAVNTQSISIRQAVDQIKLGVNYKFDLLQPVVIAARF